jgi:hypothetical protein
MLRNCGDDDEGALMKHVEITKEGITWKTEIEFVYKTLNIFRTTIASKSTSSSLNS